MLPASLALRRRKHARIGARPRQSIAVYAQPSIMQPVQQALIRVAYSPSLALPAPRWGPYTYSWHMRLHIIYLDKHCLWLPLIAKLLYNPLVRQKSQGQLSPEIVTFPRGFSFLWYHILRILTILHYLIPKPLIHLSHAISVSGQPCTSVNLSGISVSS